MKRTRKEPNHSKRRKLASAELLEVFCVIARWLAEHSYTSSNLLLACKSIYGAAKLKTNRLDVTVENLPWMLSLEADKYELASYAAQAGNLAYLQYVLPECDGNFSKPFREKLLNCVFRYCSTQLVEYCVNQLKIAIRTLVYYAFRWDRLDVILEFSNWKRFSQISILEQPFFITIYQERSALNGPKIIEWTIRTQLLKYFEVFQADVNEIFRWIVRWAIRSNNMEFVNLLHQLGKFTQKDFEANAKYALNYRCENYLKFLVNEGYSLDAVNFDSCIDLPFLMHYVDNFGSLDSIFSEKKTLVSYEVAVWISSKQPLQLHWSTFFWACADRKLDDWQNLYRRCVLKPIETDCPIEFDLTIFNWLKTIPINWYYLNIRGDIPSDFFYWLLINTTTRYCPNDIGLKWSIEIARMYPGRLREFRKLYMRDQNIETLSDEDWIYLFKNIISKRKLLKLFLHTQSFANARFIMDKFDIIFPFNTTIEFFTADDIKLWRTWFPNQLETKKISYEFLYDLLIYFTPAEIESMDQTVYSEAVNYLNQTDYLNFIKKRPA